MKNPFRPQKTDTPKAETKSQRLARSIELAAAGRAYLKGRAEREAALAAKIAESGFAIDDKSVAGFRDAHAAVLLARELDAPIREAVFKDRLEIASVVGNRASEIESAHSQIDRLIAAAAHASLPSEFAGATVDVRESAMYREEHRARYVSTGSPGTFLQKDAPLEKFLDEIEHSCRQLDKIEAELARCSQVLERLQPVAAAA